MKTKISIILICFISHLGFAQVFQDQVANETLGEFPSQWDVIAGMANVAQKDGNNFISILHGGIIKPIVNEQTNNYLSGDFTLEFDAYFDRATNTTGQRLIVRLWNGQYSYSKDKIKYNPFIITRHGLKTSWNSPESGSAANYRKELKTLESVWRHIKFEVKEGKLKIYIDDLLLLQFPRFKMQPTMFSIGGGINEGGFNDTKIGVTNVMLTAAPTETKIVMFVDKQTNAVKDINLYSNLQKLPNLKSVYPNTTTYFGTIYGNYAVNPIEFSDIKKPKILSGSTTDKQTVRPHEYSDIEKPQFLDLQTYGKYTVIPEKETQMVFDFEKEFNTENITLNGNQTYATNISGNILRGDYFETNTTFPSITKNLTTNNGQLYLLPKGATIANQGETQIGETEKNLENGTKIILVVDRTSKKVQNIELYETMQDPALVNKKYPNSTFHQGMLYGNYSLVSNSDGEVFLEQEASSSSSDYNFTTLPDRTTNIKPGKLPNPTDNTTDTNTNTVFDPTKNHEDEIVDANIEVPEPLEPIDATTVPQFTPLKLTEKPIKLKVTLTDLVCIKEPGNSIATYRFEQSVDYRTNNTIKIALEKLYGNKKIKNQCDQHSTSACVNPLGYGINIRLSQTGKKESNVMNALIFEIFPQELSDTSAKFLIKSYLRGDNDSYSLIGNDTKILYDSYIEVDIYHILADLKLAKQGKNLEGFTVPFHDPEIMKAKYGLFKTYDGGPNAKLWVRQVGKTLEGPISLGNTTDNKGYRGAAWIKFEILD